MSKKTWGFSFIVVSPTLWTLASL